MCPDQKASGLCDKLLVALRAYLKMSVDSHLETTANYIDQESYYTVEDA